MKRRVYKSGQSWYVDVGSPYLIHGPLTCWQFAFDDAVRGKWYASLPPVALKAMVDAVGSAMDMIRREEENGHPILKQYLKSGRMGDQP